MLLQLTTMCHEGCSHCFVDATADGVHMAGSTLTEIISFIKNMPVAEMSLISDTKHALRPTHLIISGGEPTEHPSFFKFIQMITEELPFMEIIIESNGSWLGDAIKEEQVEKTLNLKQVKMMLVTSYHKFYPNYKKFMVNKDKYIEFDNTRASKIFGPDSVDEDGHVITTVPMKITVEPDWQDKIEIVQLGRAAENPKCKINNDNPKPCIPNCLQMPFVSLEQPDLTSVLISMEHKGLYTSFIFAVDGTIYNGISQLCNSIIGHASIHNYNEIYDHINRVFMPCGKCKLNDRIPEPVLAAIRQHRRLN